MSSSQRHQRPVGPTARMIGGGVLALAFLVLQPGLRAQEASGARGDEPAPNAGPRHVGPRPIRFERLTAEQGLSQGTVNSILQDRTGFLWLGTQGGLNRYDGYRFEVYRHRPGDPSSLPHDWVLALAEDPSGDLWVGTDGGGLSRWRRATDSFENLPHGPDQADERSLGGHRVVALAWDPGSGPTSRALWVATLDGGLDLYDPASGLFRHFRHRPDDPESLADDQLGALHFDRAGNFWVGTWGGLDLYDPARQAFVHYRHDPADPESLSDDRVRAILEDRRGDLWIGTHAGLNRFDRRRGTFERYFHDPASPGSLSHDWVRSLYEDRDGRLWVGTDGGLNLWREEDRSFARYRSDPEDPHSLGSDQIVRIAQDRGGVLWVGTLGGGLGKWNPKSWQFSHLRAGVRGETGVSNNIFAVSEDRQGGLWIGTFGSGLERLDRGPGPRAAGTGRRVRYAHDPADPRSLSDDRVTALLHDADGELWIGTVGGGLNHLADAGRAPAAGFEHFRHHPERPESLSHDAVTALYQDRRRRLWVGTLDGGLNRHLGAGTFLGYRHDPADSRSLGSDRVFALAEDEAGRLWVATDGGGLNRLEPLPDRTGNGIFLRLEHDPADPRSLASNELLDLHVDAAGRLWIGTQGGGLDRLEDLDETSGRAMFRNYSRADGLPDDMIWGVRSDASGHLWLATNHGLSRLDPETGRCDNYDTSHGLPSNEFNQGAHFASPSGELFFGGVNGVSAFFPQRIRSNTAVPAVVLTALTRFNEPLDLDRPLFDLDALPLSYRDHFLAFEFAALDFTAPQKNRYRYQLAGFDDKWIGLGSERRVTFASLEPGRYTLRVQGSNSDGVWNEEGLALQVTVKPPFWQTWWFRGLGFLATAAAVWVGYLARTRQIRRLNIRLQGLVDERTRELEAAQEQLVKKERLAVLGELAGSVAHEIRNPIAVIGNALFLLRRKYKGPDGEPPKEVGLIDQQIQRTNRIVSELLDYAQGSSTQFMPFSLQEAAEEVLGELEVPPTIRVDRRFEDDSVLVEADAGQVQRILRNLLQNGLEAMPEGGTLRLECRRVGDEAVISVIDTGIGISEEDLPQVFEPLFTTKANGIGLGLPLSQRYARLNQGRLECDSLPERGAIFRLVLPAHEVAEPGRADLETQPGDPGL